MQRFQLNKNWVALAHKQPPEVSAQIRSLQSAARQQHGRSCAGSACSRKASACIREVRWRRRCLASRATTGRGSTASRNRYNDELSGTPGRLTVERDVAGQELDLGDRTMDPPQNGADLYLTIDHTMQFIVEQQLAAAVQQHQATGGTIIVMNPHTGAILAMASVPTYDPNHFETTDAKLFVDPAVSAPFEPGSTFKLITMSAGIELHDVTPDTTMVDKGSELIGGQTIWDWDHKAHGTVTMVEVLAHSLNLGAAFVGRRVGANDFYRYVQNFGFGQRTGIDVQGEAAGSSAHRRELLVPHRPLHQFVWPGADRDAPATDDCRFRHRQRRRDGPALRREKTVKNGKTSRDGAGNHGPPDLAPDGAHDDRA